jgi:hypothetical protein
VRVHGENARAAGNAGVAFAAAETPAARARPQVRDEGAGEDSGQAPAGRSDTACTARQRVTAVFAPTRDEARRFLTDAWHKYRGGAPLSGLEQKAVELIAMHPEYHAIVEAPDVHVERDYRPEQGDVNPFLHLSLHLAVAEQLAIDQPPGIVAQFERLRAARGDAHAALHAIVECLGEVVWQAQRTGTGPDAALYLDCLARR